MATTNVKTHSGNRVSIQFDGIEVGLVETLQMDDDYGHEPVSGIGDARAEEHVPGMARYSLQASNVVLKRRNLRQAAIVPDGHEQVLRGLVFDIVVMDKDTNRVIAKYLKCTCTRSSISIQKHVPIRGNASFMAIERTGSDL